MVSLTITYYITNSNHISDKDSGIGISGNASLLVYGTQNEIKRIALMINESHKINAITVSVDGF